jgi:hypothetical protein
MIIYIQDKINRKLEGDMENNIKRERLKEFYFKIKDCHLF